MARLEVQELCKGWDFPVIDRLSFTVEEGEFFVIVGASGIGKTTLLRLISGLETPDGGRVIVGGQDQTRLPPYRRRIAMTFESYALYPHLSVYDNIASPLKAKKAPAAERDRRVRDVAKLLRIDHLLARKPGEVSGGQKQRTALGRTLVADPDVFLLDEPISHLDAKIRHELRTQFHTLEDLRKVATVYVTHDYAEALSLGDRIGVMGPGGKLVQVGAPRDVFETPANLTVAEHLGQPTMNIVPALLEHVDQQLCVTTRMGQLTFPVFPDHAPTLDARSQRAVSLGVRPQSLRPVVAEGSANLSIDAEVDIYEPLGASGIMIAQANGLKLTALTNPEEYFHAGQPVKLSFDPKSFHYFDPDTGQNIMASS